jgi:hypothetical protein
MDENESYFRQSITVSEQVANVELFYPRNEGNIHTIEVGLSDVRAADSIQISYDFDRDGWSIKQASRFEWICDENDDGNRDPDWQEVAFVQAWAREVKPTE